MGKNNASAKHISEVGNYGDQREFYASKYVREHAPHNDPDALLFALEEFDLRWTMLHLGSEKGDYLDRAVREVIVRSRISPCPVRALEIGAYIGYSAIRIGRLLATEAHPGSTLVSVEQNEDNAGYAREHVHYAGLSEIVTVLHSRIEECFDDEIDGDATATPFRNNSLQDDSNGPYDLVFLDHRKPFYLRDLKLLESKGVIDPSVTVVVADNVSSLEHVKNREEAISKGKRKGPCKCVNKACDYLDYVKRRWSSTDIFYGENTKDGISVSRPTLGEDTIHYVESTE